MYVVERDVVTLSGVAVGRGGISSGTVGVSVMHRTIICHNDKISLPF